MQDIMIGNDIKVTAMSGLLAKYLTRPRRMGKIVDFDEDNVQIRFPQGKRDRPYYFNDHWFRRGDTRIVHTRGSKKMNLRKATRVYWEKRLEEAKERVRNLKTAKARQKWALEVSVCKSVLKKDI